jgi:hypothetical protein
MMPILGRRGAPAPQDLTTENTDFTRTSTDAAVARWAQRWPGRSVAIRVKSVSSVVPNYCACGAGAVGIVR